MVIETAIMNGQFTLTCFKPGVVCCSLCALPICAPDHTTNAGCTHVFHAYCALFYVAQTKAKVEGGVRCPQCPSEVVLNLASARAHNRITLGCRHKVDADALFEHARATGLPQCPSCPVSVRQLGHPLSTFDALTKLDRILFDFTAKNVSDFGDGIFGDRDRIERVFSLAKSLSTISRNSFDDRMQLFAAHYICMHMDGFFWGAVANTGYRKQDMDQIGDLVRAVRLVDLRLIHCAITWYCDCAANDNKHRALARDIRGLLPTADDLEFVRHSATAPYDIMTAPFPV